MTVTNLYVGETFADMRPQISLSDLLLVNYLLGWQSGRTLATLSLVKDTHLPQRSQLVLVDLTDFLSAAIPM